MQFVDNGGRTSNDYDSFHKSLAQVSYNMKIERKKHKQ